MSTKEHDAKEQGNEIMGGVLKNLAGLFVIWLSLYLVALAHDLSTPESKRASRVGSPMQIEKPSPPSPDSK